MTANTATAVQAIHAEVTANEFHRRSVAALHAAEVPFLIGGAYMVEVCGGVSRSTKDFDLYVRPNHVKAALRALARAEYKTELTFPHWLAKGTYEGDMLDLIFRAGNGLCEVNDSWFDRARDDELLGVPVKLCAPEEMIWMKAYIMERERFDGADNGGFDYTAPERSEDCGARRIMPRHAAFAAAIFSGRTGVGTSGCAFGKSCSDE
jgi:hypothetical protein